MESLALPPLYDPNEEGEMPSLSLCAIKLYHEGGGEQWLVYGYRAQAEWTLANIISGNGWYHLPFQPVHPDWGKIHGYSFGEPIRLSGFWNGRRVLRAILAPRYNMFEAGYAPHIVKMETKRCVPVTNC